MYMLALSLTACKLSSQMLHANLLALLTSGHIMFLVFMNGATLFWEQQLGVYNRKE